MILDKAEAWERNKLARPHVDNRGIRDTIEREWQELVGGEA